MSQWVVNEFSLLRGALPLKLDEYHEAQFLAIRRQDFRIRASRVKKGRRRGNMKMLFVSFSSRAVENFLIRVAKPQRSSEHLAMEINEATFFFTLLDFTLYPPEKNDYTKNWKRRKINLVKRSSAVKKRSTNKRNWEINRSFWAVMRNKISCTKRFVGRRRPVVRSQGLHDVTSLLLFYDFARLCKHAIHRNFLAAGSPTSACDLSHVRTPRNITSKVETWRNNDAESKTRLQLNFSLVQPRSTFNHAFPPHRHRKLFEVFTISSVSRGLSKEWENACVDMSQITILISLE